MRQRCSRDVIRMPLSFATGILVAAGPRAG